MNTANLIKLYEVGQKILREQRRLGFGCYRGEDGCGTFYCLSGWYGVEHGLAVTDARYCAPQIFGITDIQADRLFMSLGGMDPANDPGPEAYAELERRMTYLAGLIREAGGTVPGERPKHTGIPAETLAIFDRAVA